MRPLRFPALLLFALLATCLFLPACAPKAAAPQGATKKIAWPPAPMKPKIEWVEEIKILEDGGAGRGFWRRMRDFFLGPDLRGIVRPYGVCMDEEGRLFVADTGAGLVHILDRANFRYWAVEGDEETPLRTPIGLASAGNGNLYITDSTGGAILRYGLEDGSLSPFSPYRLERPTGIAFGRRAGMLYVSDTAAHEVVVFDLSGVERFRFGGRGTKAGQFNYPTDLWVDDDGLVYVTDALNARIQVFSAEGEALHSFGRPGDTPGSFSKPKGVAVDEHGHIYVCDALFDAVQVFDGDGRLLLSFGDNGSRPGQFWMPSGIFVDDREYIYVADTYNRRIQVFRHIKCKPEENCAF